MLNIKIKSLLFFSLSSLSLSCFAVQPLTDSDMDVVSAELGQNVLNVLGSPAAGLTEDDDSQLQITQGKVAALDDGARVSAADLLEEADEVARDQFERESVPDTGLSFDEIEKVLSDATTVTREANKNTALFETSSEMVYRKSEYHKDVEVLDLGTVRQTRDITIDIIRLENLKGGFDDDDNIAGSIYLSDFKTQGVTTLIERP